jgi:GMP synthase (glutamine-hydrolysing)
VRILSLTHQADAPSGVFGETARALGHEVEEASIALGHPPAAPLAEYGALMVFGGGMHVDQDDQHPWLHDERRLLKEALDRGTPTIGLCLGSQLVAQVAGARVGPLARGPEIGWCEVELTQAAADDPLLAALPARFSAFEWHSYGFEPPPRAALLARSAAGAQAFALERAWGVQFHAEVTAATLAGWVDSYGRDEDVRAANVDPAELAAQSEREAPRWNELGRRLATAFLEAAARA